MDPAAAATYLLNQVESLDQDLTYIGSELQRLEQEFLEQIGELRDMLDRVAAHLDDAARQLGMAQGFTEV